jgi:hypothetical protein
MMTTRQRGVLLAEFIEVRRARPFAWGDHDCCLMAADWVAQVSGRIHGATLRGRYSDAAGALRLAQEVFGQTERPDLFGAELWPAWTGLVEIPARHAMRGDLVSILAPIEGEADPLVALAICVGAEAAAAGLEGLRFVRMPAWRRAWRVAPGARQGEMTRRVSP